jgi:RecB family endonuclease NucS
VLDFDLGRPRVADVGATLLPDPTNSVTHEVDVVGTDEHGQIVLVGEAKASKAPLSVDVLAQLDRMVELIPDRRVSSVCRVVLAFSGADG